MWFVSLCGKFCYKINTFTHTNDDADDDDDTPWKITRMKKPLCRI